jgi:hypothetical protein
MATVFRCLLGLAICLTPVVTVSTAQATEITWIGASREWDDINHWDIRVPLSTDTAIHDVSLGVFDILMDVSSTRSNPYVVEFFKLDDTDWDSEYGSLTLLDYDGSSGSSAIQFMNGLDARVSAQSPIDPNHYTLYVGSYDAVYFGDVFDTSNPPDRDALNFEWVLAGLPAFGNGVPRVMGTGTIGAGRWTIDNGEVFMGYVVDVEGENPTGSTGAIDNFDKLTAMYFDADQKGALADSLEKADYACDAVAELTAALVENLRG